MSVGKECTVWEVLAYDADHGPDGWEIVATHVLESSMELALPCRHHQGERYCAPTKQQIRDSLDCHGVHVDITGADIRFSVRRRWDQKPIGEIRCVSHESLTPVRAYHSVADADVYLLL